MAASRNQVLHSCWLAAFSFIYAIRHFKISIRVPSLKPVLDLLWNERMIFFSMVVVNLYTTTNVVLLGFLQLPEQVGYYTAGYRLIIIMQTLISMPLAQSLFLYIGTAFGQSQGKRDLTYKMRYFPLWQ